MSQTEQIVEVTECVVCKRPLGQETRDMEICVCHEHRKCGKCGRDCQRAEIDYCISRNIAIKHARCLVLESRNTLDTEIELMNLARLLVHPDPELSRETLRHNITKEFNAIVPLLPHDIILLIVDQAQALAAAGSLALSKNRREIEQEVSDRESTRFTKAKDEAAKNNRTVSDRKAATNEEKSLKMFTDMGMSVEKAKEMVAKIKASKKDMLK